MPADSSLCSPDGLMKKQARKGQTQVKGQMESKSDADDVFAGAHGDGDGDGRRATQPAADGGWMTAGRAAEQTRDEVRWLVCCGLGRWWERPGQPEIEVY